MRCFICNEEMKPFITEIDTGWGDYKITIKGVTAYKCAECDNEIYSPEETKMIQTLSSGFAESTVNPKPEILNVKEVADLLRVTTQTVYNMLHDGRLKANKIGREWRFSREKVIESLGSCESAYELLAARGENISKHDKKLIDEMFKN